MFKRFWSFPEVGFDPNRGRALVDRVQGGKHRGKGREIERGREGDEDEKRREN